MSKLAGLSKGYIAANSRRSLEVVGGGKPIHQRALRALIAMQVAVIEHADESATEKTLKECNAEWQKIVKELERNT